jgi:RNA polymerase sigma-70 factor (ECF subfamily)
MKAARFLAPWRLSGSMTNVKSGEPSSSETRPSLLNRLKTGDEVESWQEFYRVYGKLVRDFAIQAGLTDTEADEVVQETAIAVARHLPEFHYDRKVCRFKTWLLNQSSWRVKDQIKKRKRNHGAVGNMPTGVDRTPAPRGDDTSRTSTVERVPDPRAVNLDELFENEWRKNLMAAALDRVKAKFTSKQFQIFDLNVLQQWPAGDVANSLGVSVAAVYLAKHRVGRAVKKEVARLERALSSLAYGENAQRHDP